MEIYVYNRQREKLDILQNYISIQWQKCYDERGEFFITLNETESNLLNYKIGHILHKTDDNTLGYISHVKNIDGKMEIRGYLDNLADRVNYDTVNIVNVERDLYRLVNANKRGLEITTAAITGLSEKVTAVETTYQSLGDTFSSICKLSGLGYRQVKNESIFGYLYLYKGRLNEDGVLSEEFNNLFIKEYTKDISNFKNYAIVAGEGEGTQRRIVHVDRTNGGDRYELFVDARDLQRTYKDASGVEHTYTDAEYDAVLSQRGNQKLDEVKTTENFKIDYDVSNESYRYGQDWALGDILKSKSIRYGFVKYMRVKKIKEIYENDYKVVATLEEVSI